MSRYWEENPNHYTDWGEKGGLPVDPRTIHKTYNSTNTSLVDTDRDTVILSGAAGHMTINATERQKQREIAAHQTPAHQ